MTVSPSGTSAVSSTKIAPRFCSVCTTYLLCTISLRTYTGGPYRSSAFSTATTARSTPAQYPRGAASSTRLVFTAVVVRVSSAWPVTPPWYGAELTPPDPHHRRSTTGSGGTRVGGQPPGRFHPTSLSLPSRHRQRGNAWRSEPQVLPQRTGLREQHHQDPARQTQAPSEGRSARASTAAWTGRRCAGALNKVLPVISPQMVFQPPASDQTRRTGQAEGESAAASAGVARSSSRSAGCAREFAPGGTAYQGPGSNRRPHPYEGCALPTAPPWPRSCPWQRTLGSRPPCPDGSSAGGVTSKSSISRIPLIHKGFSAAHVRSAAKSAAVMPRCGCTRRTRCGCGGRSR